jgi:hypothetical protein
MDHGAKEALRFGIERSPGRPDLELDDRNLITLCENERDRPADDHHGQGSKTDLGRPDCLMMDRRVPILISA